MPPSVEAMEAMPVTLPCRVRSGNAGKVTLAVCPTATFAMSSSLTWTVTFICDRSAICIRDFPDSTPVAEAPT